MVPFNLKVLAKFAFGRIACKNYTGAHLLVVAKFSKLKEKILILGNNFYLSGLPGWIQKRENKGSDLFKPAARHFNFPGHSHEHMEICGINLHLRNNETQKRKEQKLIFKLGALAPSGINQTIFICIISNIFLTN